MNRVRHAPMSSYGDHRVLIRRESPYELKMLIGVGVMLLLSSLPLRG